MFLQDCSHGRCGSEQMKAVPFVGSWTWSCVRVIYVGGTGFEGINESWISAESCHCERPGGAISKGTALVVVEAPVLKSS